MRERPTNGRVNRAKPRAADDRQRTRSLADVGRMFDDLYSQLDRQLTRMAEIQLQFDALRSKIRLL
jgi:hypothetical protein